MQRNQSRRCFGRSGTKKEQENEKEKKSGFVALPQSTILSSPFLTLSSPSFFPPCPRTADACNALHSYPPSFIPHPAPDLATSSAHLTTPLTMAAGDGPLHPLQAPFTAPATTPTTHRPPASSTTVTAAGPASGATTRRRAKSFLRNYYGIQQADAALQEGAREKSSSHPGGASLTKADPYDLGTNDAYMPIQSSTTTPPNNVGRCVTPAYLCIFLCCRQSCVRGGQVHAQDVC